MDSKERTNWIRDDMVLGAGTLVSLKLIERTVSVKASLYLPKREGRGFS